MSKGRLPTEIIVETTTPRGRPIQILLTADTRMTSLIRGAHGMLFQELWNKGTRLAVKPSGRFSEFGRVSPLFSLVTSTITAKGSARWELSCHWGEPDEAVDAVHVEQYADLAHCAYRAGSIMQRWKWPGF